MRAGGGEGGLVEALPGRCRAATAALHVCRCTPNLSPSSPPKLCLMRAACESCTSSVGRVGPNPFLRPPAAAAGVSSVSSMAFETHDNGVGGEGCPAGLGVSGIRSVGGGVDGGTLSLELTELALRSWIDSALFRLRSRRRVWWLEEYA